MNHTLDGYRIEMGKTVIDETAAEQVKTLFASYFSGDSLDRHGFEKVRHSVLPRRHRQNTAKHPIPGRRVFPRLG